MPDYCELRPGGALFAQAEHFRLGTDSVLLADFINTNGAARGIDLGCASGAVALLVLLRTQTLHMTGLEIVPEAAELARENMRANALEHRSEIICGDIREHRALFKCGSFDLAAANPPYFPVGSGVTSPKAGCDGARSELQCSLDELCAAAAWLCRSGGRFCVVHRPERLSELFLAMCAHGIEPKRLRPVCPRLGAAPGLVLVEGRRGARPGLKIEPELPLRGPDGEESGELREIYARWQSGEK